MDRLALLVMDVPRGVVGPYGKPLRLPRLAAAMAAAPGVMFPTAATAADRDCGLVILRDGCADADPDVHRVLMDKVFPHQAEVLSVEVWVARVGSA